MSADKQTNNREYSRFLSESGLSEEIMWRIMGELAAPTPNRAVDSVFILKASPIHGIGMFATRNVSKGESFPVCRGKVRYNLARYVNHSDIPNTAISVNGIGEMWAGVSAVIQEGDEVTMDYRDNMIKSYGASSALLANRKEIA